MSNIETIRKMVNEFSLVQTKEQMLDNYKWFSLASSIDDEELTLKLLREVVGKEVCQRYDNLKRLEERRKIVNNS